MIPMLSFIIDKMVIMFSRLKTHQTKKSRNFRYLSSQNPFAQHFCGQKLFWVFLLDFLIISLTCSFCLISFVITMKIFFDFSSLFESLTFFSSCIFTFNRCAIFLLNFIPIFFMAFSAMTISWIDFREWNFFLANITEFVRFLLRHIRFLSKRVCSEPITDTSLLSARIFYTSYQTIQEGRLQ